MCMTRLRPADEGDRCASIMDARLLLTVLLALVDAGFHSDLSGRFIDVNDGVTVDNLATYLELSDDFSFSEAASFKTAKGSQRIVLRQSFKGLEILGPKVIVEGWTNNFIRGNLIGNIVVDVEDLKTDGCVLTEDELLERAYKYLQEKSIRLPEATPDAPDPLRKVVQFERVISPGDDGRAFLAYVFHFVVIGSPMPISPRFLFDACDPQLRVVRFINEIQSMHGGGYKDPSYENRSQRHYWLVPENQDDGSCEPLLDTSTNPPTPVGPVPGEGGNVKVGKTIYGDQKPFCLEPRVEGNTCVMDTEQTKVLDANFDYTVYLNRPLTFPCDQGLNDSSNGAFGVANDAFFHTTQYCRMYQDWYGLPCFPFQTITVVNFGNCFDNAFIAGGRFLVYGSGCTFFHPLVGPNIVGHELGHVDVFGNSRLRYTGQSGGIHEAFTDVAGEALTKFIYGQNEWQPALFNTIGPNPVRYMEMPSLDGRSIDRASDFTPSLNVHFSSGVFNRFAWQLANVQKLSVRQVFEIFLLANRVFWDVDTNFQDGACDIMRAAYDLGFSVQKILSAFAVVDINLLDCDFQAVEQTIALGERRKDVLVSRFRNPIFTLDIPPGVKFVVVRVTTKGSNYPRQNKVKVSITSDAAGHFTVTDGNAPLHFHVTDETRYLKLSALTSEDIRVHLSLGKAGYFRYYY